MKREVKLSMIVVSLTLLWGMERMRGDCSRFEMVDPRFFLHLFFFFLFSFFFFFSFSSSAATCKSFMFQQARFLLDPFRAWSFVFRDNPYGPSRTFHIPWHSMGSVTYVPCFVIFHGSVTYVPCFVIFHVVRHVRYMSRDIPCGPSRTLHVS